MRQKEHHTKMTQGREKAEKRINDIYNEFFGRIIRESNSDGSEHGDEEV